MTSYFVAGTKWLLGVPVTWRASANDEDDLAGESGTREFGACNMTVRITSMHVTSTYCTYCTFPNFFTRVRAIRDLSLQKDQKVYATQEIIFRKLFRLPFQIRL